MNFTKLKKLFAVTTLGLLMLTLTGCSSQSKKTDKISIMTTTNVYADIAKNVVGKYGTAQAIIKNANVDPHDFEPTTNDAKAMSQADIVVANGLGYDSWMNKLASSVDKKPILVGEDLLGLKKGDNPHVWFDLKMPAKYVDWLVKELSRKDPQHSRYYRNNGRRYLAEIARVQKAASKIGGHHQSVYVSEPVFDYALKAAGFKVADKDFEKAVQNNTDPSPATVQKISQGIKERKISFFVVNSQTSSSTVDNFVKMADEHDVPVLKIRETIPAKTTYLEWMTTSYQSLAEIAQK
ncbi:metal ABC transporter substrate-binding protein [Lactobacillus sp. ESL0245]|nr:MULTISPECIES: zinc ABC transporter substrate-binding protein [unclassified Lactobacillus]RMC23712.1 metal ABC transporter substrate-binding protein [Lactobacillus sp. ESL0247]RMC27472.1 metal ABC transporter substrate-binding protein [Lactobacillus sp. ESL0246]RMC30673.1 metal ABC transporter substrate-binding protein [Lactobacillus sp. ESL0245]RMC47251.1 metal ABC transporter substrate-binding protein [Lactobacillus sp. ESL0228]